MRTLSANALTVLNQKLGTEPVNIVEIDWGNGGTVSYADKAVENIPAKILELGGLDSTLDVTNSNFADEVSMRLNDTDGSIKAIFNTQEIHEVDVRVYQWFEGLDLDDKFLVFSGKASSPISWKEADRSFTLSAVSQLEDREFGFSAEEGQFPYLPSNLVGRPWPSIFGKELDVPALQINNAVTGTTLCPVGILSGKDAHTSAPLGGDDCGLGASILQAFEQISLLNKGQAIFSTRNASKALQLQEQANQIRVSIANAVNSKSSQELCAATKRADTLANAESKGEGCNPVRILGGEDFPQGVPIRLNINGGLFTGTFDDDQFTISSRVHPENESAAVEKSNNITSARCETPTPSQYFDFSMDVPDGTGDFKVNQGDPDQIRRRGFIVCTVPKTSRPTGGNILQHFYANAGARVSIDGDEPITFIASITPGEVLAVKAFKTFNGERTLTHVPESLYTVETKQYGSVTAVQVTTTKPLSTIENQGWSDQIYVSFESTIGPNPVDILEYIIDNYTSLTYDSTSFDSVKTSLDNGGKVLGNNMAILTRVNTVDLLKDIAFLNRLALWVRNGVFFLKYLPVEPSSDLTITTSDFRFGSVEVTTGVTEDLVTKMIAEWRLSEAEEEPQKIVQRNNIDKYGTKEETIDWFTHNQPDIIQKAMAFWTIRLSNSYKRISFDGFMHLLQLEPFDTVLLDLPDYVANSSVKAIVEEAVYDSARRSVRVTCLVPVRTGEMTAYPLFWPSAASGVTYPIAGDEVHAGGSGIGANATGDLPIGDTSVVETGGSVFVGGPNVVYGPQSDRGPTDVSDDFTPQEPILDGVFANVQSVDDPNLDLDLNYVDPFPALELPPIPTGNTSIDIRTTLITDSENDTEATLDSVFKQIADGLLEIDTAAKLSDGTNSAEFDFKYDENGGKFGAGTAFLQDDA